MAFGKTVFGQMTFRSNGLSVKWSFGQMVFGQKAFGQMVFRSLDVRSKTFGEVIQNRQGLSNDIKRFLEHIFKKSALLKSLCRPSVRPSPISQPL
jgi:hypothetical protein